MNIFYLDNAIKILVLQTMKTDYYISKYRYIIIISLFNKWMSINTKYLDYIISTDFMR